MPTTFPGAIDALTNPSSGSALTSPSHASQHTNANDAIEAIETALGPNLSNLPLGCLGFAQVTADQGGITSAGADLTGLSVTVNVIAGRRIKISADCRFFASANDNIVLYIKEGAAILHSAIIQTNAPQTLHTTVVIEPSAGAHTYKLAAGPTGASAVTLDAGAGFPSQLSVDDIGPA